MPSTGFTIFAVSRVEGKIYQHVKVNTIQFRAGRVELGPNIANKNPIPPNDESGSGAPKRVLSEEAITFISDYGAGWDELGSRAQRTELYL